MGGNSHAEWVVYVFGPHVVGYSRIGHWIRVWAALCRRIVPERHESFHVHFAGLSCHFHATVRLSCHFHVGMGLLCRFFDAGHE